MIVAQVATVGREEDNVAINMKKVDNCYCYSKSQNKTEKVETVESVKNVNNSGKLKTVKHSCYATEGGTPQKHKIKRNSGNSRNSGKEY